MGGGSGHGYKFGPALGEMAMAALGKEEGRDQLRFDVPEGKFDPDRFEKQKIDQKPDLTVDDTSAAWK